MTKIYLTDHAIHQFRERWLPDHTRDAAERNLASLTSKAERLDRYTRSGEELWRVGEPPVLLVVGVGDNQRVCKTVLPAGATFGVASTGDATVEEVVAAYQRAHPVRPPQQESKAAKAARIAQAHEREIANLRTKNENLKAALAAAQEKLHAAQCALGQEQMEPSARARHERDQAKAQRDSLRRKLDKHIARGARLDAERNAAIRIIRAALPVLVAIDTPEARAVIESVRSNEHRLLLSEHPREVMSESAHPPAEKHPLDGVENA